MFAYHHTKFEFEDLSKANGKAVTNLEKFVLRVGKRSQNNVKEFISEQFKTCSQSRNSIGEENTMKGPNRMG